MTHSRKIYKKNRDSPVIDRHKNGGRNIEMGMGSANHVRQFLIGYAEVFGCASR